MSASESAANVYGVWQESITELVSYRYLGCRATLISRERSQGTMTLRRDMRSGDEPLGAPLTIAMLDAAGINIDRLHHAAVTHTAVQIVDGARGVDHVRIDSEVIYEGRTQLVTQATIVDESHPDRVVAVGSASWSVLNPTPAGFEYIDPGPGVSDGPDLPELTEPYHAVAVTDGGFRIEGLVPAIGGAMLHHGPIIVTLEAAALRAAERAGRDQSVVRSLDVRFVRPGVGGPFRVAPATVLGSRALVRACRSAMVDEGRGGRVIAVANVVVAQSSAAMQMDQITA